MARQREVDGLVQPGGLRGEGLQGPRDARRLKALSDQIVKDGGTPWCAGIESGVATGWPITDWFEDFMLRLNGPEVYDQWVQHTIPFNDPKVKAVADAVGSYLKNPDYLGGENNVKAIATTKFQDGGVPITTGDCYMHRQASFYSALFPEGTTVGPPGSDSQISYFYLPVAKAGDPKVMLGAGDILAAGTDKPETWDTILYADLGRLRRGDGQRARGSSSPRNDIDASLITDPLLASFADLLKSFGRLPLRRRRHDARRSRVRHVLDRGDGVDRWWQHRRHAEQHRSQLARQLIKGVGREGPGLRLRALRPFEVV